MRNKIISHYYCDDDKIIREVVSCLKMLFLSFIVSVARIWKKNEIFEIQKGERGLKNEKLFILNFTAFFSSNENIKLATLIIILTKHTFLHSFICKYKLSRMLNPTGGQMCKKLHVWWLNHLQTFSAVCLHLSFNNYYKDKGCRSESWHFEKKLWRSDEWRWGVDYVLSGQGVIF